MSIELELREGLPPTSELYHCNDYLDVEGLTVNILPPDMAIYIDGVVGNGVIVDMVSRKHNLVSETLKFHGAVSMLDSPGTISFILQWSYSPPDVYTICVETGKVHRCNKPAVYSYNSVPEQYEYEIFDSYFYHGINVDSIVRDSGFLPGSVEFETVFLFDDREGLMIVDEPER